MNRFFVALRLIFSPSFLDLLKLWNRGLRQIGWSESASSGVPSDHNGPLPWLTYGSIDYIDQIVPTSARVLEIGGGNSSRWWKSRGNYVTTLESDAKWMEAIENVSDEAILCRTASDVASWIQKAADDSRSFDVVLVDGVEPRSEYIEKASDLVKKGGLLIVDNSDRASYAPELEKLRRFQRVDFFGLGPSNRYAWCTSVFFEKAPSVGGRSRLHMYSTVQY